MAGVRHYQGGSVNCCPCIKQLLHHLRLPIPSRPVQSSPPILHAGQQSRITLSVQSLIPTRIFQLHVLALLYGCRSFCQHIGVRKVAHDFVR
jgi:hypothetical protein